jgi:exosome complex component RRP4
MFHVKNKEIVVPGELIATGNFRTYTGTEKDGEDIYSTVVGLSYVNPEKNYIKIVPLEGKYVPQRGDSVIGVVEDLALKKAIVNINSAHKGILDLRDTTARRNAEISDLFSVGDTVYAKVSYVSDSVDLYAKPPYGKLHDGRLIHISSTKVPRVIGRKGSMISLIKKYTGCKIYVGQNGTIWIKGQNEEMEEHVREAITLIDAESHTSGLTERITVFLEKKGD